MILIHRNLILAVIVIVIVIVIANYPSVQCSTPNRIFFSQSHQKKHRPSPGVRPALTRPCSSVRAFQWGKWDFYRISMGFSWDLSGSKWDLELGGV